MSECIGSYTNRLPEEELLAAIIAGEVDRVEKLIENADPNHPLFMGGHLISMACKLLSVKVDLVEILLRHGCNANGVDNATVGRGTPLHQAAHQGNSGLVDILLRYNADCSATNRFGEVPLHLACRSALRNSDAVEKILQADPPQLNRRDSENCTPLYHATASNNPRVVKVLVNAGCDLDAENDEFLTALDRAIFHKYSSIVTLLVVGGCSLLRSPNLTHYGDHYCNSLPFSLIENNDIHNLNLVILCGYRISHSLLRQILNARTILTASNTPEGLELMKGAAYDPLALYSLCRIVIRQRIIHNRNFRSCSIGDLIMELDLPKGVLDFLTFHSECHRY